MLSWLEWTVEFSGQLRRATGAYHEAEVRLRGGVGRYMGIFNQRDEEQGDMIFSPVLHESIKFIS